MLVLLGGGVLLLLLALMLVLLGGGVLLLLALLTTTAQTENQVEGGFLLDIVVRKGATILQLFAGEDQPLLVGWDALLVLDLGLDVLDGVRGLDLKGDCFTSQGLDEDLHSSSEPEDEMKGALLLDVVIREGPTVLELLASEDQPLLVWGDSLLVLDLGLDVLDGVGGLHLKGDSLSSQGLDEDLHSSSEPQDEMEG